MTPEEAQKLIDEEATKRAESCSLELKELLDRHGCTLDIEVTFHSRKPPEFAIKVTNSKGI